MTDQAKQKFQSFLYPVLAAGLSFFLFQTYKTLQDIDAKVDAFIIDSTELRVRQVENERRLLLLEDYVKENEAWVKRWLEDYQGAVEWAKKNAPNK